MFRREDHRLTERFRFYSARLLDGIDLRTDGFDMESEVIVRADAAATAS
jgi:hypothetical protein